MEICPLSFMYINYPDIFRVSGILVGAVGKGIERVPFIIIASIFLITEQTLLESKCHLFL